MSPAKAVSHNQVLAVVMLAYLASLFVRRAVAGPHCHQCRAASLRTLARRGARLHLLVDPAAVCARERPSHAHSMAAEAARHGADICPCQIQKESCGCRGHNPVLSHLNTARCPSPWTFAGASGTGRETSRQLRTWPRCICHWRRGAHTARASPLCWCSQDFCT